MFYSVECQEEVPFNNTNIAEDLVADYPATITEGLIWEVEDSIATCNMWGSTPASIRENQPVSSDIPTLLLAGEYDPVTPPSWAEAAAKTLSNAQLFVFNGYSHAVVDAGPCPREMILDFLTDPYQLVDATCMSDINSPDFHIDP
jgi:pimeloyl-ACP methyl ester carboxylesterase